MFNFLRNCHIIFHSVEGFIFNTSQIMSFFSSPLLWLLTALRVESRLLPLALQTPNLLSCPSPLYAPDTQAALCSFTLLVPPCHRAFALLFSLPGCSPNSPAGIAPNSVTAPESPPQRDPPDPLSCRSHPAAPYLISYFTFFITLIITP